MLIFSWVCKKSSAPRCFPLSRAAGALTHRTGRNSIWWRPGIKNARYGMPADFHPLKRYVESTANLRQVIDIAKFYSEKMARSAFRAIPGDSPSAGMCQKISTSASAFRCCQPRSQCAWPGHAGLRGAELFRLQWIERVCRSRHNRWCADISTSWIYRNIPLIC